MTTLRRSPATTPLPSVKLLIAETWRHFTADWKHTFLLSRWIILPGFLVLAATLLARFAQLDPGIFLPLIGFGMVLLTAWVKISLIQHELGHSQVKALVPFSGGWKDIGAYIWMDLWHGVALIGMLLPFFLGMAGLAVVVIGTQLPSYLFPWLFLAALVLALPLFWMSVSLAFWPFILFDADMEPAWEHLKGPSRFPSLNRTVAVFVASYELVRGRWWSVFVRFIVPGLLFGLLLLACINLADFLIKLIASPEKIEALFGRGASGMDVNSSSRTGYSYFLQSLGLAVFFPLFIGWQAKLYKMLKA